MKKIWDSYKTEREAAIIVARLINDGYSAYRQGKIVYIDDGGEDND